MAALRSNRPSPAACAKVLRIPEALVGAGHMSGGDGVSGALAHTLAAFPAPPEQPQPLLPLIRAAEPYPVDALGEILAGAVIAIVRQVQCPPALAAQSVLAAASLAAQGHHDVMHPMGRAVPLSLMLVTIAE